jgi:hypothetical protein
LCAAWFADTIIARSHGSIAHNDGKAHGNFLIFRQCVVRRGCPYPNPRARHGRDALLDRAARLVSGPIKHNSLFASFLQKKQALFYWKNDELSNFVLQPRKIGILTVQGLASMV